MSAHWPVVTSSDVCSSCHSRPHGNAAWFRRKTPHVALVARAGAQNERVAQSFASRGTATNSTVQTCVSFCGEGYAGINVKYNRTRDARTWRAGRVDCNVVAQCMAEGQATSDMRQLNRTVWAAYPHGSGPFVSRNKPSRVLHELERAAFVHSAP
jgi:hypothetical protein